MHPNVIRLLALMTVCLSACSSDPLESWHGPLQSVGMAERHRLERSTQWVLTNNTRLYVATPIGSQHDASVYRQLVTRFSRYYPHTQAGIGQETLASAFASARQAGMDVVVYPLIIQRQTRQGFTEVALRNGPFRDLQKGYFDIDLGLYTVSSKQRVDHFQFESRAGVFTTHEEDVLWKPLDAYLRLLSQY